MLRFMDKDNVVHVFCRWALQPSVVMFCAYTTGEEIPRSDVIRTVDAPTCLQCVGMFQRLS